MIETTKLNSYTNKNYCTILAITPVVHRTELLKVAVGRSFGCRPVAYQIHINRLTYKQNENQIYKQLVISWSSDIEDNKKKVSKHVDNINYQPRCVHELFKDINSLYT